jgi:hypothetical protein
MAKRALSARRCAAMNSLVSILIEVRCVLVVLVVAEVRVIKEEKEKGLSRT